jgi:hypothetical protein
MGLQKLHADRVVGRAVFRDKFEGSENLAPENSLNFSAAGKSVGVDQV